MASLGATDAKPCVTDAKLSVIDTNLACLAPIWHQWRRFGIDDADLASLALSNTIRRQTIQLTSNNTNDAKNHHSNQINIIVNLMKVSKLILCGINCKLLDICRIRHCLLLEMYPPYEGGGGNT